MSSSSSTTTTTTTGSCGCRRPDGSFQCCRISGRGYHYHPHWRFRCDGRRRDRRRLFQRTSPPRSRPRDRQNDVLPRRRLRPELEPVRVDSREVRVGGGFDGALRRQSIGVKCERFCCREGWCRLRASLECGQVSPLCVVSARNVRSLARWGRVSKS